MGKCTKVPVTILTGQLGSGKSTLLRFILSQRERKVAVLMNEFSSTADIEGKKVTISQDGIEVEEWLELDNGCLCCSAQDSGVRSIERLMEKKGNFDAVIIETSGVADPSTIAPLFWLDEGINSDLYLDGVICVVDAVNFQNQIKEDQDGSDYVSRQIGCSDTIILSKLDLAPDSADQCRSIIKSINTMVPIHTAIMGNTTLDTIFDLNAYGTETQSFSNLHSITSTTSLLKHTTISSVTIPLPKMNYVEDGPFDKSLRTLLWEGEFTPFEVGQQQILRCKGIIVQDDQSVYVVQGVRDVYNVVKAKVTELIPSRLIVIGKHLNPGLVNRFLSYMHEQK